MAQRLENSIVNGGPCESVKDFVSKLMNNISRIVAILHIYLYSRFEESKICCQPINQDTLAMAINIGTYYLDQAKFIYGDLQPEYEMQVLGRKLYNFMQQKHNQGWPYLTRSQMLTFGPNQIRQKDKLDMALTDLMNNAVLLMDTVGKETRYWFVNQS